jgi:hypothetical protein
MQEHDTDAIAKIEVRHARHPALGHRHSDSGNHFAVSLPRDLSHPQHGGGTFGPRLGTTRRQLLAAVLTGQSWDGRFSDIAATLLAQWINASRQQALAAGTEPVPQGLIPVLSGYFAADLVHAVRWRLGAGGTLSLPGLAFQYGDAAAVTLIDVVLFQQPADARGNAKMWAHELTHAVQYRRWGVDGFAARYVADSAGVEREAYANADRFEAWRAGRAR